MKRTIQLGVLALAAVSSGMALAKLPAPSDEAKAKAAEAAAKAAHGGKVAAFQLCKSQERVALAYRDASKKAGKDVKPPVDTPACADPGPFGAASAPAAPAMAAAKPAMAAKK
jgi:hypothetical protein